MSQRLDPLSFPLHGSRLIEASAGTGKTWTIAALYVRLVLGHGGADGFGRPLAPPEILVMTFTRAATRELSNRIRERLLEAAGFFRGASSNDPFLQALAAGYPDPQARSAAAHRLALAAETMDEAAVFTIDAWGQRMLREHAFDSGSLFDEELVGDENTLFDDAANDYWRAHVYPLDAGVLDQVLSYWGGLDALKQDTRDLVKRRACMETPAGEPLAALVARKAAELARVKDGWLERIDEMDGWISAQLALKPKRLDGALLKRNWLDGWFGRLREWAADESLHAPRELNKGWERLTPAGIAETCKDGYAPELPDCFARFAELAGALQEVALDHALIRHACVHIARRMDELKRQRRLFGFADLLERLRTALEGANGPALRRRITGQFPVALIDEFQDTSPEQYRVFDLLYRVADNERDLALFLIGDPKQSIYGFRGADIHSYLAARGATTGRHYQLGVNYRSTAGLVGAVNQVFLRAEGHGDDPGFPAGAFRFRKGELNPLPFDPVGASGKAKRLVASAGPVPAMAVRVSEQGDLRTDPCRRFFAQHCAEHIVTLLNDPGAGFGQDAGFTRLAPADIAVLVRDRTEASLVRRALDQRGVASVYLSDKDSVLRSVEAADMLRWLTAVAAPLDGGLARAAFATRTAALPLAALARLSSDESQWEQRVEQLKALHAVWQRQGVLAMLRRFIHELELPAKLHGQPGGERTLTNLLHLAEILQQEAAQLDGEQALIRWFAEQLEGDGDDSEERVLRLESDSELVKVITVHKSKGLEYPLVYLPFAASARPVTRKNRSHVEVVGESGQRSIDLSLSDAAIKAAEAARIEEDLRLLYVALTRAAHFIWMGVGVIASGKNKASSLHKSALGYLLAGGSPVPAERLLEHVHRMRCDNAEIDAAVLAAHAACTHLNRVEQHPAWADARVFEGEFERDWSVGSFTSITRQASAPPARASDEVLMEPEDPLAPACVEQAAWHRFPRGAGAGSFMHDLLELLAREGLGALGEAHVQRRLEQHIRRAGWDNRRQEALDWLAAIVATRLPPLGAALAGVSGARPEMEFWFPSERLDVRALDRLCAARTLGGIARPLLPARELHGMLKGFADLVFEHEGKYWVLDYKSNALGGGDAAYTKGAMEAAMAAHRYDIQGAIYMQALHRLLASRLGEAYDPARQLGGAIFLFLRGIGNESTRGCCLLEPDAGLLDALDRLLTGEGGHG